MNKLDKLFNRIENMTDDEFFDQLPDLPKGTPYYDISPKDSEFEAGVEISESLAAESHAELLRRISIATETTVIRMDIQPENTNISTSSQFGYIPVGRLGSGSERTERSEGPGNEEILLIA